MEVLFIKRIVSIATYLKGLGVDTHSLFSGLVIVNGIKDSSVSILDSIRDYDIIPDYMHLDSVVDKYNLLKRESIINGFDTFTVKESNGRDGVLNVSYVVLYIN